MPTDVSFPAAVPRSPQVRVPPAMGSLKSLKELNLRSNNLDDRYKAKVEEGLSRWGPRQRGHLQPA